MVLQDQARFNVIFLELFPEAVHSGWRCVRPRACDMVVDVSSSDLMTGLVRLTDAGQRQTAWTG